MRYDKVQDENGDDKTMLKSMQMLTSLEQNVSSEAEVNIDVSHLGMTLSKYNSDHVKLCASSAVFTPNQGEFFQRYQVVLHSGTKKMF
jgi:hypothetical protein